MKKRSLALICAIVMLATLAMPIMALASQTKYVYTSNHKTLNLRSAPVSNANNKIASIPYATKLTVDRYVNNGKWAYVKYNNQWGYVMSRYLVDKKPAGKPAAPSSGKTTSSAVDYSGFVATSYQATVRPPAPGGMVNLRWGPSKSTRIYQKMYDGQAVEVISQNNTWAQVRLDSNGYVGFVMRQFLTVVSDGSVS